MLLSEMCRLCDATLVRESEVTTLGFIDQDMLGRLVFAGTPLALRAALSSPGVGSVLVDDNLDISSVPSKIGLATAKRSDIAFLNLQKSLFESTTFYRDPYESIISDTSTISSSAAISKINVKIGDNVRLAAGVVIEEGCIVKKGVTIHPNAVIGSEGFQVFRFNGMWESLTHAGGIIIEENATILAGAVVARGVFRQDTIIGEGSLVGNNAFVSHNSIIGKRSRIGHGAVITGNCRIGDGVTIGPGAVVLDRLVVNDGAFITAGSIVARDVPVGGHVSGNFAIEHKSFLREWLKKIRS